MCVCCLHGSNTIHCVHAQASIRARGMEFCRIDGTMLSAEERQAEVRRFQEPRATIPVFMLTSQVGGSVGALCVGGGLQGAATVMACDVRECLYSCLPGCICRPCCL